MHKLRITGGEPLVRKGIVELIKMISRLEGITDLSMTTNGTLLDQYANDLKIAGLQRVNISLDTIKPEKYMHITRGGELSRVFSGIKAAKEAGLNPVKINCVVFNSSKEEDALEVEAFCKKNQLKIRYIHQMNLENGTFSIVEGGDGGDCEYCNRLRLTSEGFIKPCLFNDLDYSVRDLGIEKAFKAAIENKPGCGSKNQSGRFYSIGG